MMMIRCDDVVERINRNAGVFAEVFGHLSCC